MLNYKLMCLLLALLLFISAFPVKAKPLAWEQKQLEGLVFRFPVEALNDISAFKEQMKNSILNYVTLCKRNLNKERVTLKSCRTATPGGCEQRITYFVDYFVKAGKKYDLNPWLLAAMAYNESRYNPFAVGPTVASKGILQLNPKSRRGRHSKFVRSVWFRRKCKKEPGNCQEEIVLKAADYLVSAIYEKCEGNFAKGLSMYNTGRCEIRHRYIKNTAKAWRDLQYNNGMRKLPYCTPHKK